MDIETVKRRIRDLQAKTAARGCTEAEAMAAAAKAAELMAKYGLEAGDLEFSEARVKNRTRGHSPRDTLYAMIAFCTNTAWHLDGAEVAFTGRSGLVEIAVYLKVVLDRALNRAIAEQKRSREYRRFRKLTSRRAYIRDFTGAMIVRLCKRLVELFAGTLCEAERNSAMAHRDGGGGFVPIIQRREKRKATDMRAVIAGARAGQNVPLHHAAGGSADRPLAIGSGRSGS